MSSLFKKGNTNLCVTAFYALSLPEFHMALHSHDSCEIMYVTGGSCTIQCETEEFQLMPNQFVFIDASVAHRLLISGDASGKSSPCAVLNLEFQCCQEKTSIDLSPLLVNSPDVRSFYQKGPSYAAAADTGNLGYALKDLILCLKKAPDHTDYLLHLLMHRFLLELALCMNQQAKPAGMYYLKKACSYIDDHLLTTIKIEEIAAYTGINKSYLQGLFSKFMHCTIIDYRNRKRIEHAVFLLINSSMCITDIAFSAGFNSRQHFAHTFGKYYSMGPSEYRKLHSRTLVPDTGEMQYLIKNPSTVKTVRLRE